MVACRKATERLVDGHASMPIARCGEDVSGATGSATQGTGTDMADRSDSCGNGGMWRSSAV